MYVSVNSNPLVYVKYDGSPRQLMDYLNGK